MNHTATFADWEVRSKKNTNRMLCAVANLDEQTLNVRPDKDTWSPAQVIEHLVLSNRPYMKAMEAALTTALPLSSDPEITYSRFGAFLIKAAGPDGNAPAPPTLHPRKSQVPLSVLDEWKFQQTQFHTLLKTAQNLDIVSARIQNPIVPIFRMNLADCFELLVAHTERHVAQVEERIPRK